MTIVIITAIYKQPNPGSGEPFTQISYEHLPSAFKEDVTVPIFQEDPDIEGPEAYKIRNKNEVQEYLFSGRKATTHILKS